MLFRNRATKGATGDNVLPIKEVKSTGQKVTSWIDYAGQINRNEWLIVGWAYHPTETDLKAKLSIGRAGETCELTLIRGARPDVCIHHGDPDLDKQPGFAIIARLNAKEEPGDKLRARLVLEIGNEKQEHKLEKPGPVDPEKAAPPLGTFSAEQRSLVYKKIFDGADPLFINQLATLPKRESRRINIDDAISLPDGFFINGWFDNSNGDLVGIYLLSGNRLSSNIINEISWYHRKDIVYAFDHIPNTYDAGGFAYVPVDPEEHNDHIGVITVTDQGEVTRNTFRAIPLNGNEIELTQKVLGNVDIRSPDLDDVFGRHIDTALRGIWQERISASDEAEVSEYGSLPEEPRRSVIVPVYGRYDLVLYQLSQFASDPDFRDSDLVYVLDDPSIKKDFLQLCDDSYRIFQVPFRVVMSGKNQGFACANNLGVSYARSDTLVLLNSDVIPHEKGWLQRLQDQYDSLDKAGVLGVRLVYEDETIQHDGMEFIKSPEYPAIWLNDHPNKGLPVWLAEEPGCRETHAVTAACMMVGKDRYDEAGGLDPSYILGDFEDSDFCLKLREKGYRNYLLSTVQLYHLERQSQNLIDPGDWKHKLTIFNGWLHTGRWEKTINNINSSQS
ncbi:MAG: glycosyltransferase [Gammaproteobacteria bacterium]|nr:glycosyltransferase [Gammaproteobacteria bacterium]